MFKSKFLNNSFNNKASSASKGTFVKLILSVLSKKGNWARLLKILNKIVNRSRIKTVETALKLNCFKNSSYTSFSSVNCKKEMEKRSNFNFIQFLNLLPKFKNKKILLGLKNKSIASRLVFSNLRSIHSLLKSIAVFIELKNKRRGGRVFSVPVPVKSERRRSSIFIH
jgi:hypothetical protein